MIIDSLNGDLNYRILNSKSDGLIFASINRNTITKNNDSLLSDIRRFRPIVSNRLGVDSVLINSRNSIEDDLNKKNLDINKIAQFRSDIQAADQREINYTNKQLAIAKSKLSTDKISYVLLLSCGIILFSFGAILWYVKVQKPLDDSFKFHENQARNKNEE